MRDPDEINTISHDEMRKFREITEEFDPYFKYEVQQMQGQWFLDLTEEDKATLAELHQKISIIIKDILNTENKRDMLARIGEAYLRLEPISKKMDALSKNKTSSFEKIASSFWTTTDTLVNYLTKGPEPDDISKMQQRTAAINAYKKEIKEMSLEDFETKIIRFGGGYPELKSYDDKVLAFEEEINALEKAPNADEKLNKAMIQFAQMLLQDVKKEKDNILQRYKDGKTSDIKEAMERLTKTLDQASSIVKDPTKLDNLKKIHQELPKEGQMTTTKALLIGLLVVGTLLAGAALAFAIIGITHGAGAPVAFAVLKGLSTFVLPYLVSSGAWAHLGSMAMSSAIMPSLHAIQGFATGPFINFVQFLHANAAHYVYTPAAGLTSQMYAGFMKSPLEMQISLGTAVTTIAAAYIASKTTIVNLFETKSAQNESQKESLSISNQDESLPGWVDPKNDNKSITAEKETISTSNQQETLPGWVDPKNDNKPTKDEPPAEEGRKINNP